MNTFIPGSVKFLSTIFLFCLCLCLTSADKKYWRGGWGAGSDVKKAVAKAKELGFNAIMQNYRTNFKKLNELCQEAKKENIEIYYWISLSPDRKNKNQNDFYQQVSKKEAEKIDTIRKDKDPYKNGYQHGGEAINQQTDVFSNDLLCFHRPEVIKILQEKITTAFKECPDLAGIAFDYFGYANYRRCRCPYSMRLFEEYYKKQPNGTDREKALRKFSLDSLVDFNNQLAAFVRKTRSGAKIVTHIYPTYIYNPVYGNLLDVDYCCQTVAWYFKPYWNLDKVKKYTKFVIGEQGKFHPNAKGIPFVGIYQSKPALSKPTDVFRKELRTIRSCGTQSLSICPFTIFNKKPELSKVFLEEMGK